MGHDCERHCAQLLQCLTQDKKPIGFLLGAGCSFSIADDSGNPLVPDIDLMTHKVIEDIRKTDLSESLEIIHKLLQERLSRPPDIEEILTYVRGTRHYPGGFGSLGIDADVLGRLETSICHQIRMCVDKELSSSGTPFHTLANWISSVSRETPIELFTTNYDLLIEQALEDQRVPYFDGFVGSRKPFFDSYAIDYDALPPRWARLWKIHGSVNWRRGGDERTYKVYRASSDEGEEVVIHPSHLKYDESRRMPYLALMDHLRRFLSRLSSALFIVGYSFRDQHLNDTILQGLQGSPSSAAFALMYSTLDSYPDATTLAKSRGNLSLLASDGAVIGTRHADWNQPKEKPESDLPSESLDWNAPAAEGENWTATFRLGDFGAFGQFLQEISGRSSYGE